MATGQQLHKLTAADAAARDEFGYSVSISGDIAIVGAPSDDDAGTNSGSAYLFDVATGQQLHKLTAADAAAGDWFGYSVSISGGIPVVGAIHDDDACPANPSCNSGSAYVFETCADMDGDGVCDTNDNCPDHANEDQADCDDDGIGDVCAIADGLSEDCNANGTPDGCDIAGGDSEDCNANGVPDECDIENGDSTDNNANGVPDECDPCVGDLNDDALVDAADLAILLGSWGPCGGCPADIFDDGDVNAGDLAILLGNWGPCG